MSWFWWAVAAGTGFLVWRAMKDPGPSESSDGDGAASFVPSRPPPAVTRRSVANVAGRPMSTYSYEISYGDVYGELSDRKVDVLAVAKEPVTGYLYLKTFCRLRNDDRTFRVDRIRRATRLLDGMIVADLRSHFEALALSLPGGMQWWGGLSPSQLRDKAEQDSVMSRARAGLGALIWLAQADGEVSEAEISVMFDWIDYRALASRSGRSRWDRDLARQTIRDWRVTLADVRNALGRMGKAESAQFERALVALAEADGVIDRLEEGRIAQIKKVMPSS